MKFSLALFSSFMLFLIAQNLPPDMPYTNSIDEDRMLIVLAPPAIDNRYYKDVYDQILAFDIAYAKRIIGKDNVVIIADAATKKYLEQHLPKDILIEHKLEDIWLRDCSMVNPAQPLQFRYAAAAQGGVQADADYVQNQFNQFAKKHDIQFKRSRLILDGGNYVDNYNGKAIVSDRFMTDNQLSYATAKKKLKKLLNLEAVAIILAEDDKEGLGHADGQVLFIDDNTVVVTDYQDADYQKQIQEELERAFPNVKVLLVPTEFGTVAFDAKYGTACGLHVNSTVTKKYIYFPVFNGKTDAKALELVKKNTSKTVVAIDASAVCTMGGSVRCLSWQLMGENAVKLIKAARKG